MSFPDPSVPRRQPYRGIQPYHVDDALAFFGRDVQGQQLAELWRTRPLTVLHGPTGSGKTSLLEAGTVPRVADPLVGRLRGPAPTPAAALPPDHNPWTLALLGSWNPSERLSAIAGMSVTDFVGRLGRRRTGPLLIAIDQFDDFFQGGPHKARHRGGFLTQLVEALEEHPRLRLLLVVRDSRAEEVRELSEHFGRAEWFGLGPLDPKAAFEAVTRPLEWTARRFSDKAVPLLLAGLASRERTVEPVLLQAVCTYMWNRLPTTLQLISEDEVFRWADAEGAIAEFVRRALARAAEKHGLGAGELRAWAQATFFDGFPVKQGMHETGGMSNAIIQALEDAHLLRSERGNEIRLLHKGFREALGDPLDADPADRSSHLAAAKAALEAGDPALAERRAAEALRRDGTDTTDACALLGDIALEYARYDRAESRASEADRRYEEAFRRYSLALRQYADIADMNAAARTLAAIGQVLIGQGEFSEAAERLEQARTLRPHDTVIRTELARALWLAGSRSRAMIEIDGVLRDEGDQYTALRTRGEFNADQGRAEDALRDLARVSSGAWPVTRAARALALASLERLAPAEADEQVEAVVHQAPTHGPALFYAARVEALNGDRSAASDLARRAVAAAEPRLSADQRERALKLVNDAAANS